MEPAFLRRLRTFELAIRPPIAATLRIRAARLAHRSCSNQAGTKLRFTKNLGRPFRRELTFHGSMRSHWTDRQGVGDGRVRTSCRRARCFDNRPRRRHPVRPHFLGSHLRRACLRLFSHGRAGCPQPEWVGSRSRSSRHLRRDGRLRRVVDRYPLSTLRRRSLRLPLLHCRRDLAGTIHALLSPFPRQHAQPPTALGRRRHTALVSVPHFGLAFNNVSSGVVLLARKGRAGFDAGLGCAVGIGPWPPVSEASAREYWRV